MNLPPEQDPSPSALAGGRSALASAPSAARLADLELAVHSLRRLLQIALAALILAFAGLNVYLFSQVRSVRYQAFDLNRNLLEMNQVVQDYETNSVPWMEKFTAELHRFAESHADFAPTMARYPKASAPPPSVRPKPAASPGPPTAPARKK